MRFCKMSGAGNDFVLLHVEGPGDRRKSWPALARRLCDRRLGIGADGLLILSARAKKFRLRYFNADGSPAFCGNGTRCAAWWLFRQGHAGPGRDFEIEVDAGKIPVRIRGRECVSIKMPAPRDMRLGLKLKILGRPMTVHFLNTGVPHAVVEVKNLRKFPVVEAGRILRRHKAFAPEGANVDFISIGAREISMRTYERGVEDETLACGTGAAASALVACGLGKSASPVNVRVQSGDRLKVYFQDIGNGRFSNVWLEGPAKIMFKGEISL